ncbi:MAG: ribulokinase [Faecousia sp.]
MSKKTYTIGLDFGSLSCRAVLVDTADGGICGEESMEYPHGVMDRSLPDGTALAGSWALQHPRDYVDALLGTVPRLLERSGIDPGAVVGIGVDFTASTVVALDRNFVPLCLNPAFASHPHAWVKLWKHHGGVSEAEQLTKASRVLGRPYLDWYGGVISPECLLAKVIQVYHEDRQVYDSADCFMEAGDYITSLLAGAPVFGLSAGAAKAFWSRDGYPDSDFFASLDPGLRNLPREKLMDHFPDRRSGYPGEKVGKLCPDMAKKLGLPAGIAVSAPQMDAYAAMPGLGITEPGVMLLVIGTSTGVLLMNERRQTVEGVTACLPDTYYPGLYGYGSGQSSVGDTFQWFLDNCLPENYRSAARQAGVSDHTYLSWLAEQLRPGQTGLLALDWFNGNRSCLANSRLSGMILGLRLGTRPEHIYRALLEATAFGVRAILEAYERGGVGVREVVACGGIAVKNPFLMQMYADVLDMPIQVSLCKQAPALGAAIQAAAAAGCYCDLREAARVMGARRMQTFTPDPENTRQYQRLYGEYIRLYDYFGRGENPVMETLLSISGEMRSKQ